MGTLTFDFRPARRAAPGAGGATAVAWLGYEAVPDEHPLHLALLDAAGAKVRDHHHREGDREARGVAGEGEERR